MCALIFFANGTVAGSADELSSLGHPTPLDCEMDGGDNWDACFCTWGRSGVMAYLERVFPGRHFDEGPLGDWDEVTSTANAGPTTGPVRQR